MICTIQRRKRRRSIRFSLTLSKILAPLAALFNRHFDVCTHIRNIRHSVSGQISPRVAEGRSALQFCRSKNFVSCPSSWLLVFEGVKFSWRWILIFFWKFFAGQFPSQRSKKNHDNGSANPILMDDDLR